MRGAGLTFKELAVKSGCNMKTAQRWYYEGRVPHPARARRIAAVLHTSPAWLWPDAVKVAPRESGDDFRLFPALDGEPSLFIEGMLNTAEKTVDVCSGSHWFLERTASVALRSARRRPLRVLVAPSITWNGSRPPQDLGLKLRAHDGVGLLSLLRTDDSMLIVHSIGMNPASAPALFLGRRCADGTFDRYADGFDALWDQASDLPYKEFSLWQRSNS